MIDRIDPIRAIIGYIAMFLAVSVTYWTFLWAMPASHWFEYATVKPVEPVGIGEQLSFQSFREIRRPASLSGIDVLFCDLKDGVGFQVYSDKDWDGGISLPSEGTVDQPRPWRYGGKTPAKEARCYLKSTIDLDVGYGIVKQQGPLISETFAID